MSKDSYNSVGAGETMRLGVGKPEGLARSGGKATGHRVPKAADFGMVGKPARPGGREKGNAAAGSPPKVARPGGPEAV